MDDSAFFSVPLNSYGKSPCSPMLDDDDRPAVRIAAPATIDPARHETLPLCGTLRMQARFMAGLDGDPIEAVVVVVVRAGDDRPLSFNLRPDKQPVDTDPNRPKPEDFDEDDLRVNHFNVDLLTFSPQLADGLTTGRYVVYAVLGATRSNAVTVQVLAPKEARP